jgi:hypothetical protein
MSKWEEAFNPFFVRNVFAALLVVFVMRSVLRLEIVQVPCKWFGYLLLLCVASSALVSMGYTLYHTGMLGVVFNAFASQFTLVKMLQESELWQSIVLGMKQQ